MLMDSFVSNCTAQDTHLPFTSTHFSQNVAQESCGCSIPGSVGWHIGQPGIEGSAPVHGRALEWCDPFQFKSFYDNIKIPRFVSQIQKDTKAVDPYLIFQSLVKVIEITAYIYSMDLVCIFSGILKVC